MLFFKNIAEDFQAKTSGHTVEAEFQDYDAMIREGIQNSVDAMDKK